ncbi:MAG TPA: hypothetical protein PKH05_11775 [Nitrospira sp.]|nr:hypothetical protein [Nitrospira sp.]HNN44389.1 hypothetical protein [Nitrospira sp.]
MELFAIAFSIPVATIASTFSMGALQWLTGYLPSLRTPWLVSSCAVLVMCACEVLALASRGAVGTQHMIGTAFYPLHLTLFFLGVPAFGTVLRLENRKPLWLPIVVSLYTAFALVLVLLQYGVTEALYGIDGNGEPYSK